MACRATAIPSRFSGGSNSFFLLVDQPQVYGLPDKPQLPTRNLIPSSLAAVVGAAVLACWDYSTSAGAACRRQNWPARIRTRQEARMPPSDTFFTTAPHWSWLVVLYFFLGGIAGGSYFLAALIDLMGGERDRSLARLGYYVAFPLVLVCALLLIVDLTRPESFWHMLIQSERIPLPIFKYWSPMSVGSWALLIFGGFSFFSFVGSLAEEGRLRWGPIRRLDTFVRRGPIGKIFALVGSAAGFFLASYTGVLAEVTNRPIWADNSLLGLLFLTSAASTAGALLILLARSRRLSTAPTLGWLVQMDRWAMLLELVALAAVLITLGPVAQALLNVWGMLLVVVVVLGILIPLGLAMRQHAGGGLGLSLSTILVLVGGLILRAVIVFASESS